ncbi:YciI family protein [Marinicaulis aureus]|uniref:YciI family protein n=1 Tax=Hyphococcus aureus TaxID=2666033 RepID=A0ABW1KZE4_9PROT
MNYLLMLYDNEDEWAAMEDEKRNGILGSYFAYTDALRDAGAYVDGNPLEHSKEGKRARQGRVEDGPFADGKETLGGYYLIEAPDLDAALDWAARCPCASFGYVEVRPVWNVGG